MAALGRAVNSGDVSMERRATRTGTDLHGWLEMYRRVDGKKEWSSRLCSLRGEYFEYAEGRGDDVRLRSKVVSVRIVKPDRFHFVVLLDARNARKPLHLRASSHGEMVMWVQGMKAVQAEADEEHLSVIGHHESVIHRRSSAAPAPAPAASALPGAGEAKTYASEAERLVEMAKLGHFDEVQRLLQAGVDPSGRGVNGWTLLHYAAYGGYDDIVTLLLSQGKVDVNAASDNKRTPLHIAADWDMPEIAELLLAKGADKDAQDEDGKTPLQLAQDSEADDIVVLLGGQRRRSRSRSSSSSRRRRRSSVTTD